jgi:MFS family permease
MIILSGIIFTASAIGTALAPTVSWLIAGRTVSGIAIGIASFISPMYIAELAPAQVRRPGGRQHAGNHHWHCCRLFGGLCPVG